MIHLQILMPTIEAQAGAMMQGQSHTGAFEAMVAHINEHFNRATEQGVPKKQLEPVAEFLKKAGDALAQLKAIDAQAHQVAQASEAHDAEGQTIMDGSHPQLQQ